MASWENQDGKNEIADEAWRALPEELARAIETAEAQQRREQKND